MKRAAKLFRGDRCRAGAARLDCCSSVSVARVTTASAMCRATVRAARSGRRRGIATQGVPIADDTVRGRARAWPPRIRAGRRHGAASRASTAAETRAERARRRTGMRSIWHIAASASSTSSFANPTSRTFPPRPRPSRGAAGSPGSLCSNFRANKDLSCVLAPYSAMVPAVRMPRTRASRQLFLMPPADDPRIARAPAPRRAHGRDRAVPRHGDPAARVRARGKRSAHRAHGDRATGFPGAGAGRRGRDRGARSASRWVTPTRSASVRSARRSRSFYADRYRLDRSRRNESWSRPAPPAPS